jgi:hypothetical protein
LETDKNKLAGILYQLRLRYIAAGPYFLILSDSVGIIMITLKGTPPTYHYINNVSYIFILLEGSSLFQLLEVLTLFTILSMVLRISSS